MLGSGYVLAQGDVQQGGGGDPGAFIYGLAPAAWYRFNTGITVVGAGVDTWTDQSGNARDLRQTTDANRPAKNADGSLGFNGSSSIIKTAAFGVSQPFAIYLLVRQDVWTLGSRLVDGNTNDNILIWQSAVSPSLVIYAGTSVANNTNLAVGSYGVICAIYNGASSTLTINKTAATTGNAGANNLTALTIGANATGINPAAITVKEAIVIPSQTAVDSRVVQYLSQVGSLGL